MGTTWGWDMHMKFESITLLTSELEETRQFYEETLECRVEIIDQESFMVEIGETELHFRYAHDINQPYYHFAIDIPYNHFFEMKNHYQNILFLLMEDKQHTTYFEAFVAHSVYFNDPSGNIVELIARISNMTEEPEFSRISEIGFVCNDTESVYQALTQYQLETHEQKQFVPDALNFLGDKRDESFILLTPEHRRWFFSEKTSSAFPIEIKTQQFDLIYDHFQQWHLIPS